MYINLVNPVSCMVLVVQVPAVQHLTPSHVWCWLCRYPLYNIFIDAPIYWKRYASQSHSQSPSILQTPPTLKMAPNSGLEIRFAPSIDRWCWGSQSKRVSIGAAGGPNQNVSRIQDEKV